MKKVFKKIGECFKDESGQGATEYILLLVIVVAVAMVFKDKIMGIINDKLTSLSSDIGGFTSK